jgi:hypothetical protein
MKTVIEALADIKSAIGGIDGIAYSEDPANLPVLPAAVPTLPEMFWENYNFTGPTGITLNLCVVVNADQFVLSELMQWVGTVATVLEDVVPNLVVTGAIAGNIGTSPQLPCYVMTLEVSL